MKRTSSDRVSPTIALESIIFIICNRSKNIIGNRLECRMMETWNTNELLKGLEIKKAGNGDQFYCSEGYSLHASNIVKSFDQNIIV